MPASRLVCLTRAEKTCLAVLRARRSATASRQKRSATAVVEENVTGRVVGEGGCAQACPMLGYQKRKRERRERPKLQRMLGTAKARAPFPRRYSGRPVKLLRGHNSTYSLSLFPPLFAVVLLPTHRATASSEPRLLKVFGSSVKRWLHACSTTSALSRSESFGSPSRSSTANSWSVLSPHAPALRECVQERERETRRMKQAPG